MPGSNKNISLFSLKARRSSLILKPTPCLDTTKLAHNCWKIQLEQTRFREPSPRRFINQESTPTNECTLLVTHSTITFHIRQRWAIPATAGLPLVFALYSHTTSLVILLMVSVNSRLSAVSGILNIIMTEDSQL
jgi:hypothetical protein